MHKKCFVMMPFGSGEEYNGKQRESSFILKSIIEPAVEEAAKEFVSSKPDQSDLELDVIRELEDSTPGNVTESIIRHIADAHITIVDLTGRNPNVFLELGVRFALKRNGTILLIQQTEDMPFNVKAYRTVEYDPLFDGPAKAVQALKAALIKTLETLAGPVPTTTDSLVFQALPDLAVLLPGSAEETPQTDQVGWAEYWNRIAHITEELGELRTVGAYEPHILVGISNGGLLLADTVLRLVYANSLPLMCLWAFRTQDKYFENPVNDALITKNVISELVREHSSRDRSERIRILVMDDIVGTQRTFKQLVEYFRAHLGELFEKIELRFVFVYTPRRETLDSLSEYLLSEDRSVRGRHRKIVLETVTNKIALPYRKSIHYGDVVKQQTIPSAPTAEGVERINMSVGAS